MQPNPTYQKGAVPQRSGRFGGILRVTMLALSATAAVTLSVIAFAVQP
jgi:hypothetical protein